MAWSSYEHCGRDGGHCATSICRSTRFTRQPLSPLLWRRPIHETHCCDLYGRGGCCWPFAGLASRSHWFSGVLLVQVDGLSVQERMHGVLFLLAAVDLLIDEDGPAMQYLDDLELTVRRWRAMQVRLACVAPAIHMRAGA